MIRPLLLVTIIAALTTPVVAQETEGERLFRRWDRNSDGVLRIEEVPAQARPLFSRVDRNDDKKVTLKEHLQGPEREQIERKPRDRNQGSIQPPSIPGRTITKLVVRQTWHQEPKGYDRFAFVGVPENASEKKLPVVINFHGNGGNAEAGLRRIRGNKSAVTVAAQGYERSWNIFGERSEAPDVEFFLKLVAMLGKEVPQADMNNVTLVGSSNGSGFIHRLMIEVDEKPFQKAICLAASMIEQQFHEDRFWLPSKTTQRYDTPKKPTSGPRLIYFHGTNDSVVPYKGGMRGRVPHLSAQDTAYAWAKAFGYDGKQILDQDGQLVQRGIVKYDYPEAKVTHYKLIGGNHGLGPYPQFVDKIIRETVTSP